jgi:hypothetical protein
MMVNRADIYTELTKRNALRKAAKLPLLDFRTEMAYAMEREAGRMYSEQCKRFGGDRRRIIEDTLTELRATRGQDFPSSMGGRLLVRLMSEQRFRAFLEIEHGIRNPVPSSRHPIIYGEYPKS